jgi:hypothetical protein
MAVEAAVLKPLHRLRYLGLARFGLWGLYYSLALIVLILAPWVGGVSSAGFYDRDAP